jgi:hypothetical protein
MVITEEEAALWSQRASNTTITAGREYTLHGFCMAYFISVLFMSAYETSLFAC